MMTHPSHHQDQAETGAMYARLALQTVHQTGIPSLLASIAADIPRDGVLALGFFTELAKLATVAFRGSGR